jgi:hypothetical protein
VDHQTIINLAGGALLTALGWFARQLWEAVHELRRDIHDIEVDLPRNYVRKDEFTDTMKRIESIVERIFDKLESKVDK